MPRAWCIALLIAVSAAAGCTHDYSQFDFEPAIAKPKVASKPDGGVPMDARAPDAD